MLRTCMRVVQDTATLLVLLGSSTYAGTSSNHFTRQSEGEDEPMEVGSGLMNDTNSTLFPPKDEPILSASAIANIICSVLAIIFLTVILCYLVQSFNKTERETRLMTTKENNRRIDRQIAAAKARTEQRIKEANERAQRRSTEALPGSREALNIFEGSHQATEVPSGRSSADKTPPADDLPLLSGESVAPSSSSGGVQGKHGRTEIVDLTGEELVPVLNTESDRT